MYGLKTLWVHILKLEELYRSPKVLDLACLWKDGGVVVGSMTFTMINVF